jgi:hypothetical protein
MSTRQKKSVVSARPVKKVVKSAAKKHMPSRVRRFLTSVPVGVTLGVAAIALVVAKLKHA